MKRSNTKATSTASEAIAWRPDSATRSSARVQQLCDRLGVADYTQLHRLSLDEGFRFHMEAMRHLDFEWYEPPKALMSADADPRLPSWFPGGWLNWVHNALKHGERVESAQRPALICVSEGGVEQTTSYEALRHEVRSKAAGLADEGIGRGDTVGLMLPMGKDAVVAFLALSAVGAIAVPLFTGYGVDAIVARLDACGAKALICTTAMARRGQRIDLRERVSDAARRLPSLRLVLLAASDEPLQLQHLSERRWETLGQGLLPRAPETMQPNDPFMVVYTSGTTGRPKGAVHTHGGFPVKIVEDCAYHFDLHAGERWLWPSDVGWIVAPITIVGALCLGATLVCYDGAPDHPDWSRLSETVSRHGVTHFGASPTLLRGMAEHAGHSLKPSRDTLRILISAGEVLPEETFRWYFKDYGQGRCPVINYTGGTEVSGAILGNVITRPIKASGFNAPSLAVDVAAFDAGGHACIGAVGELVVRRPFIGMTRGFWREERRYFESYWERFPGVWAHGDLLLTDTDGHHFIKGRSDDTLKIAGKRVGPAEVEALAHVRGVREVAAVGVDDPHKGQRLVLVAIADESVSADLDTIGHRMSLAVQTGLGKPFSPARIHWVAELPRTRNGKVLRRLIRSALEGKAIGDTSALDNPHALKSLTALSPPSPTPAAASAA